MKIYNFYFFFNLVWEPRSCISLIMSENVEEGNQVEDWSFKLFFKNYKRVKLNNLKPAFYKTFSLGPNELSFMDFVREGWRREQVEDWSFRYIIFRFTKEWNSKIFSSYIFTFSLGPNELSFMDYVREGWRREQVEDSMDSVPKDWLKTGDSGSNFVF